MSTSTVQSRLQHLRELSSFGESRLSLFDTPPSYNPKEVVDLVQQILPSLTASSSESLAIFEQGFIACLEIGDITRAEELLERISLGTPTKDSLRVKLLYGQLLEAKGHYEPAIQVYESILAKDEGYIKARKRLVMISVSQNQIDQAIAQLVEYLDTFMQDAEGWMKLAELYIQVSRLSQASFCYEELMLLKPKHPFYYLIYAELRQRMGDHELAVKYFCATLELLPDFERALKGLLSSSETLSKSTASLKWTSPDHIKLLVQLAKERLSLQK